MNDREIKDANRNLYDAVAKDYDFIDGRRSESLSSWLKNNLEKIRKAVPGGKILDLGSGSGFLLRCASAIFEERVAADISMEILKLNRDAFDLGVCSETDSLPFKENYFDTVSAFAVLHHLGTFEGTVREISRVLKPGGIFYSDHDLDGNFYRRFGLLLRVYRAFKNPEKKYLRANKGITEEMYRLSEVHENGIDSDGLIKLLKEAGFSVSATYHWYGLSPLTDAIFGKSVWPRGFAPLVSIRASKL